MSSWIDRRINLPFRGGTSGAASTGSGHSSDNVQLLDKHDIELHLVKAQELRRLKTMRKKWFTLYEDPNEPIDPDTRVLPDLHRKARRRRTVAEGNSTSSATSIVVEQGRELSENDDLGDETDLDTGLPARLEYYDSEKKWREGGLPNKRIILKDCFDINRKKETANQLVLTVYTMNEGLDILFDNKEDMEIWLDLLLCCKNGGRSREGKMARPAFESVWTVDVIGFTPDPNKAGFNGFQLSGPHRLCIREGNLHFYPVGKSDPITFLMREIRMFGSDKRRFRFITGSNSISGKGELSMNCKDREASENLQEYIRTEMAHVVPVDPADPHASRPARRSGVRHLPPSQPQAPSSQPRPDWPFGSVDSAGLNGRSRSYSDCNKKNSPMARSIPTQKSHIATLPGLDASTAASRNRTISEGNSHLDASGTRGRGGGWHHRPNMISGSPLSPGSFVSSESAGSSNSVDSDTMAVGSFDNHKYGSTCMTPSGENQHSTIIEESSAESCIDPANFKRNRLDDVRDIDPARRPSLPVTSTSSLTTNHDVNYTSVDIGPAVPSPAVSAASAAIPFSAASLGLTSNGCGAESLGASTSPYAASPPAGSGVLYSTIIHDTVMNTPVASAGGGEAIGGGSEYMMMTPLTQVATNHSGSSSSSSSLKRLTNFEPERKRLSMLGLEEDPFPSLNPHGVTSPSSQGSYNPLEEDDNESSSTYLVMSPTGSGGTLPKRGAAVTATSSSVGIPTSSFHRRTDSSSFRSSGSVDMKEDAEDTQYVTMSPTVMNVSRHHPASSTSTSGLHNGDMARRSTSARAISGVAAVASGSVSSLGTSPSAALTSHFSDRLPLFEPLKRGAASTTAEDSGSGYLVMSPVNADVDRTPKLSTMSEKFRASSVDTASCSMASSSAVHLRSRDHQHLSGRKDSYKRSSLCSDEEVPRGWSPTHFGPRQATAQQHLSDDYNPIEDYEDFTPTKASLHQGHHHHHHHQRSSRSSFIPISQTSTSGGSASARRTSPASSSSVISGTPNSTDGGLPKTAQLLRANSEDDLIVDDDLAPGEAGELDVDDVNNSSSSAVHPHLQQQVGGHPGGYNKSRASSNKPPSRASNSSLASRGSSSRYIDIPGAAANKSAASLSPNVSGHSSVTSTTTNSGMTAWLGSLFRGRSDSNSFRNRSDSVPSRPAGDGRRRHRTQSEGENLEEKP